MENEIILCISTRRWDSLWRSTQQIMSRMADHNRVIYFEPGRNPDKPVWSEFAGNFKYFFKTQIKEVHRNVFVVPTPSNLPHARGVLPAFILKISMPLIIKINAWIEIWHVRKVMRVLGVTSPVLWLYSPYQMDFIGKFGEKLACCHNYDEYAGFAQNSHIQGLIRRMDDEFCKQVDVIFSTSRSQWERRVALNPNTYFIPNAVDFNLFNKALDAQTPMAPDVANIKKPIIGFIGWLGYQIDIDLLVDIANAYPEYSLVLVGPDVLPENENLRQLKAMKNVYFLGEKRLESLPEYLKDIDVALIPYLLEGYVLTAYPLKLHEYLAAGRAVVATRLPELGPYHQQIRIAETRQEFIRLIREALRDNSQESINARVAVAREHTWDNRIASIYQILDPLLITAGR